MPRNRQVVRELQLLMLLERARIGYTLEQLAAQTRVTTRTIPRDLDALEAAGVPLVQEDGHRWRALNWREEAA